MHTSLTVHRLRVECGLVQVPSNSGGVTVLGRTSFGVEQACSGAMAWLRSPAAAKVLGVLPPWVGLDTSKSLHAFFIFAPLNLEVDEVHLAPTIYLAMLAAATGWKQDPQVSGRPGMVVASSNSSPG